MKAMNKLVRTGKIKAIGNLETNQDSQLPGKCLINKQKNS